MHLPGTEIHLVIFFILLIEFVCFSFQILHYLSRPNDLQRLWFLLLLFFVLYYNTVSVFLPDKRFFLSIYIQNLIAYTGGVLLSIYLPFYIFKSFYLTKLKVYVYWGSILFLVLPFIMCFILPYYVTGDLTLSRKLVVIVPFIYGLSFIYFLTYSIHAARNYFLAPFPKIEMVSVYTALLLWTASSAVAFFNGNQLLRKVLMHAEFIFLLLITITKNIMLSRKEYTSYLALQLSTTTDLIKPTAHYVFEEHCKEVHLTKREIEIVHYLSKGSTYKEIANALFIAEKTVARHIANIYTKADVSNKTELLEKLEYEKSIAC